MGEHVPVSGQVQRMPNDTYLRAEVGIVSSSQRQLHRNKHENPVDDIYNKYYAHNRMLEQGQINEHDKMQYEGVRLHSIFRSGCHPDLFYDLLHQGYVCTNGKALECNECHEPILRKASDITLVDIEFSNHKQSCSKAPPMHRDVRLEQSSTKDADMISVSKSVDKECGGIHSEENKETAKRDLLCTNKSSEGNVASKILKPFIAIKDYITAGTSKTQEGSVYSHKQGDLSNVTAGEPTEEQLNEGVFRENSKGQGASAHDRVEYADTATLKDNKIKEKDIERLKSLKDTATCDYFEKELAKCKGKLAEEKGKVAYLEKKLAEEKGKNQLLKTQMRLKKRESNLSRRRLSWSQEQVAAKEHELNEKEHQLTEKDHQLTELKQQMIKRGQRLTEREHKVAKGEHKVAKREHKMTIREHKVTEKEQLYEDTLCGTCFENKRGVVVLPCRHMYTCSDCFPECLRQIGWFCPYCRTIIQAYVYCYLP